MPVKLRSAILLKELRIEIEVWAKGRGVRKKRKKETRERNGNDIKFRRGTFRKTILNKGKTSFT